MSGSRSNSTDSDYELMQHAPIQSLPEQRLQRGYSLRNQQVENNLRPQPYPVPLSSRFSRFSPNRWRNFPRQLSARSRNYSGFQNQGQPAEGDYAVPQRDSHRYDGFFRGSIREEQGSWEGEREGDGEGAKDSTIGNMTIYSETGHESCGCYKPILILVFVAFLLSISLSGLGLALYNKFSCDAATNSNSSRGTQTSMNSETCAIVVTMAGHAMDNCTREYCTTEPLHHNMTGLTPIRFHCAASCDGAVSYDNVMYREEDSVHCVCSFTKSSSSSSSSSSPCQCTVVGEYCTMTEENENGTNTSSTSATL